MEMIGNMFTAVVLAFVVSHILQISLSLPSILDALILGANVVPIPMESVLFALMEVGTLLIMDTLLFRMNNVSANIAIRRYWLVCSIMTLVLAVSPVPKAPVITFEADKFFFKMLPTYLITPQAAIQILTYGIFQAVRGSAQTWIVQCCGLLFCVGHLLYMTWLSIRRKK